PGGLYFIGKYAQQKYDQGPEAYGPFAFTAAGLIMDVIEQVGPSRRKVIEELRKTRDKDSIVGKISFDDHGQNVVPLITKYVVQDGKWVVWEDSACACSTRRARTRSPSRGSCRRTRSLSAASRCAWTTCCCCSAAWRRSRRCISSSRARSSAWRSARWRRTPRPRASWESISSAWCC